MKIADIQILASSGDSQVRELANELLKTKVEIEELRKDTDEFYDKIEASIKNIDSTRKKFFLFRVAAWIRAAERMLNFLANNVEKYKKKE